MATPFVDDHSTTLEGPAEFPLRKVGLSLTRH